MQGICGFFHLDDQPGSMASLTAMRAALVRTGWSTGEAWQRDDTGLAASHWATGPRVGLAPLLEQDAASGCRVVADARLDDREDLGAALGVDRAALSDLSDAALILQAWLRWNTQCLDRLEGDFAFAIHDPRNGGLFIARDRMGVRPLYLHHAPGRLCVFASSSAAVLAHPQVPATRNEGRVADFLITQLEGIDKTSTFHAAVERLPPAHGVWIDRRAVRRQQYWSLQPSATDTLPRSDDVWSQAVADALERAVARHLTGPAPVGCMLSGGLDSSSIAIVANAQLAAQGRGPLATFSSIDSSDGDCAETSAIRSMLALPGFDPTVIDHAAPGRLLDRLQTLVQEADEPFDALMTLVNAQYCAATDKGVDAVMDGVDGDSLFLEGAGIVRQLRSGHWRAAWKNARGQRRIHGEGAPVLLELGKAARSALVPDALRSRVTALRRHRQVRDNLATSLIAPDFAHRIDLRGRLATIAHHRSLGPRTSAPQEALEALAHPYLTAALERYHRVAAAHGAQPRHPFTDRRLLELCVNLPDRQRFHDGWSKAVLRCAMRDRLPPAVCWRTGKQHLGWALTRALLTHDAGTLTAELRANRKVLDPYVDQARLDAALSALGKPGDDAAAQLVFEALILASWLPRHPG